MASAVFAGGFLTIDGVGINVKMTDNEDGTYSFPMAAEVTLEPTNLATGAKQDTGNTALADILAKIIAAPATEATSAELLTGIGAPADVAWEAGSGSGIALLKAIHAQLVIIASNTSPA